MFLLIDIVLNSKAFYLICCNITLYFFPVL